MARGLLRPAGILLIAGLALAGAPASAADSSEAESVGPYPGTVAWQTGLGFRELERRLERAIPANGMTLVASLATGGHGGSVPSTMVLLVANQDYADRIAQTDGLAGMELPICLYVTEDAERHGRVTYRTPSSVFALYDKPALDQIAAELDQVFAKIVDDAIGS